MNVRLLSIHITNEFSLYFTINTKYSLDPSTILNDESKPQLKKLEIFIPKTYFLFLFQSRSESMLSIHSQEGGRYGTVTVRGEVEFGMAYSTHSGSLDLAVKQCRDLAAVDTKRNRSDP